MLEDTREKVVVHDSGMFRQDLVHNEEMGTAPSPETCSDLQQQWKLPRALWPGLLKAAGACPEPGEAVLRMG
jgi:hypothetical protein